MNPSPPEPQAKPAPPASKPGRAPQKSAKATPKKGAKSAARRNAKPPAPKKAAPPHRRAPILIEVVYTLCVIIVIGVTLSVALISWLAGADLLMIVVRTGSALLVTGLLLWVIYWFMANGVVEARRQQVLDEALKRKAAATAAEKAQSTMEFEA